MKKFILMIAMLFAQLVYAQDGVTSTLLSVAAVGGNPVVSANPGYFNSTANEFGVWGNPDFAFSFTNPGGIFGSEGSVYSVNNEYGYGLSVEFFQPGIELVEPLLEVP
jgi:hypothetical protein